MTLPALPPAFEWMHASWGPGLRCLPLAAIASHVFSSRHLAVLTPEGERELAAAVQADRLAMVTQVHGRAVVVVRAGESPFPPGKRPEADVLVSDAPDTAVAVRAADCTPILIADPETGAVAAVHAGWRGTAAGAVVAAVEALGREFGARPEHLVAAIGPAIGPCCYQVGPELVDAFAAAGHARHLIARWFVLRRRREGRGSSRSCVSILPVPIAISSSLPVYPKSRCTSPACARRCTSRS